MPRELSKEDVFDFRERVSIIAESLFAEQGADNVSMRQIAEVLGVSAMTPYRYFQDKDEILAAVRTRSFVAFAEALERGYGDAPNDPRAKTLAVHKAYLDFAFDNEHRYKLMFDLDQGDERQYPDLVAAVARARKSMTAYVVDLIEARLIKGEPQQLGELIWSASHGAIVLEMARKLPPGSARVLAKQLEERLLG